MKIIIKGAAAIICALCAWEVILQTTMEKSPGFTQHPVLGRINKPGDSVVGTEGFSRTKMNSLGMRGNEISSKAKNEYRILSLGDSYTKALQIADDKTYTYLLQEKLRNHIESKLVTTINGGRDGASPAQYIYLADFYKSTIQPDLVVVEIDDVSFTQFMVDKGKQFYVTKENNTYKIVYVKDFSSDNALSKLLLKKTPQLSFLLNYSVVRVGGDNLKKVFVKEGKQEDREKEFQKILRSQDYTPLADWVVQQLKNKYQDKLVILYIPFIHYNNLNEEPSPIGTLLERVSQKHNVKFVNPRKDFFKSYELTHQPAFGFNNTIPGTGHANEIGHEIIAEGLANFLEEKIAK